MEECSICFDVLSKSIYVTDCQHRFHLKCILLWVNSPESNASCPLCRAEVPAERVHSEYAKGYPGHDVDEKITVETFLQLRGVHRVDGKVILDLGHEDWLTALRDLLILTRSPLHLNGRPFSRADLTVGGKQILFQLPMTLYHTGTGESNQVLGIRLSDTGEGEAENEERISRLDRVLRDHVERTYGDGYEYKSLVKERPADVWDQPRIRPRPRALRLKMDPEMPVFEAGRLRSGRNQIADRGTSRFIVRPTLTVDERTRIVYPNLKVLQMEIIPMEEPEDDLFIDDHTT